MKWKELNAKVEALGLQDYEIGILHVSPPLEEDDPDIFANVEGTLTVANGCCR